MQNQIEKNKLRIAALMLKMLTADRSERKELRKKVDYWKNQIRIAEGLQDHRLTPELFN